MVFILLVSFVLVIVVALTRAAFIVSKDERLAVYRLGRFLYVSGPGLCLAVPFVDRVVRVNLRNELPGWQAMSPDELEDAVKQVSSRKAYPNRE
jgi:regulator of protease activity HflC (stomatin/prohibitin superfamily)